MKAAYLMLLIAAILVGYGAIQILNDKPILPIGTEEDDFGMRMLAKNAQGEWEVIGTNNGEQLAFVEYGGTEYPCKTPPEGTCQTYFQVAVTNTGTIPLKLRISNVELQYKDGTNWLQNLNTTPETICPGTVDEDVCSYRSDCQGDWDTLQDSCFFTLPSGQTKIMDTSVITLEETMGLGDTLNPHRLLVEVGGYSAEDEDNPEFDETNEGKFEFNARQDDYGSFDIWLSEG